MVSDFVVYSSIEPSFTLFNVLGAEHRKRPPLNNARRINIMIRFPKNWVLMFMTLSRLSCTLGLTQLTASMNDYFSVAEGFRVPLTIAHHSFLIQMHAASILPIRLPS